MRLKSLKRTKEITLRKDIFKQNEATAHVYTKMMLLIFNIET